MISDSAMSNGTWVVSEGKYKGEIRKPSKCTQERIARSRY